MVVVVTFKIIIEIARAICEFCHAIDFQNCEFILQRRKNFPQFFSSHDIFVVDTLEHAGTLIGVFKRNWREILDKLLKRPTLGNRLLAGAAIIWLRCGWRRYRDRCGVTGGC